MANDTINPTELRFDIIKEAVEGVTPTTGSRHDLAASVGQQPLTYTRDKVTDNTQRANRETAAPTDGAGSVTGSLELNMRASAAMDILIESAVSGEFDEDGLVEAGEKDVFFTLFSTLTDRNGRFIGYQDKGLSVTSMKISHSATSTDSVKASFEVTGITHDELEVANPLAVVDATEAAFNYVDVGGLKIDGQAFDFTDLEFSTGTPRSALKVFGKQDPIGTAATGSRETSLTFKLFREDFSINDLLVDPVPMEFIISNADGSYKFMLTHAKATVPTDELSDGALLVNVTCTAHAPDNATPALKIQKL